MDLSKIYDRLKELEKIIDPGECNLIASYLSGFIMDREEALHKQNLAVSNLWVLMRGSAKSDKQVDREIELQPAYQKREHTKLVISQMKRMRADLRERFAVLTNTKHY